MSSKKLLKKDHEMFIKDNPMKIPEINKSS